MPGVAQSVNQDSLKRRLMALPPARYEVFFANLDARLGSLPPDRAQVLIASLRPVVQQKNPQKGVYYLTRSLFRLHNRQKNYVVADSLLQHNLAYTKRSGLLREQAETLLELGYLYGSLYKYSEANRYMEEAYQVFRQLGHVLAAAQVQYEMGLACYQANENTCASYFENALTLGGDSLRHFYRINSYNALGMTKEREHQYPQAIAYYEKALAIAVATNDSVWIGLAKGNIGQVLVLMNKDDEALPYLLADLRSSIRYKELASASSTARSIAEVYLKKNDKKMALEYFFQGIELAKKGNGSKTLKAIYHNLADIYETEKQYATALHYLHLYTQVNDSLEKQKKEIAIVKAKSTFDLQKKENRMKFILEHNRRREQITLAVTVICILFLLSVILGLRINQKMKINQLLVTQKQELEKKNAQLETQRMEIESQNEELLQSQEEIAAQRDLLTIQNKQLVEVKEIISLQNDAIRLKNQTLEEQVRARTYKLVEYNRQLEQFAFITAHNLRAPVARILGLGEAIRISANEPEDERLYVEKLVDTTVELDRVLQEMNSILEKKQGDNLTAD